MLEILTGGCRDILVSQPPMKSPICDTTSNNLMLILEHEFNFNSIVIYWPAVKFIQLIGILGLPQWFSDQESTYSAGHPGLVTGSARSPGGGNGNPPQYSCLENSMERGAWWVTVHWVANRHDLETTTRIFGYWYQYEKNQDFLFDDGLFTRIWESQFPAQRGMLSIYQLMGKFL